MAHRPLALAGTLLGIVLSIVASPSWGAEPVIFENGDIRLVGDLYLPTSEGPHPALVFTHGSGGSGRDNRRHRLEAEHFSNQGIASLVFDKRGYGDSAGDWHSATFEDLAADALAAVAFLRSRPQIAPNRIGLRGASQSGRVLPIAAARSPDVAHLILISPPGVTPYEQILYDVRTDLEDGGFRGDEVDRGLDLLRSGLDYGRTGSGWKRHAERLQTAAGEEWLAVASGPPVPDHWLWSWVRPVIDFDAVPLLAEIDTPVLVLLGERDRVCPSQIAGYRIGKALAGREASMHRVRYFPEGTHDLELAVEEGSSADSQPVDGYLEAIVEWVHAIGSEALRPREIER